MAKDNKGMDMPEKEKRVFKIQMRASDPGVQADEGRTVTGYAAKFNSPSEDMGFIEYIEPWAFTEALKTSDVRCLFNHDPNLILARTSSGTLKLTEDDIGLRYEFDIPETTFGNDFRMMLKRGDVNQSSFCFTVQEQSWEEEKKPDGSFVYTRRIKIIECIYDVAPVTYAAYPDTKVALRSLGEVKKDDTPPVDESENNLGESRKSRLIEALERSNN